MGGEIWETVMVTYAMYHHGSFILLFLLRSVSPLTYTYPSYASCFMAARHLLLASSAHVHDVYLQKSSKYDTGDYHRERNVHAGCCC